MVTTRELNDLAGDRFDSLQRGFVGAGVVALVVGETGSQRVGICLTSEWPADKLAQLLREMADRVEKDGGK